MRVGFRADASRSLGTGHVMRCATLAEQLKKQGVDVFFMCRKRPGDLVDWLMEAGMDVHMITGADPVSWEEDAARCVQVLDNIGTVDWLVVDHYLLDARWEEVLSARVGGVMVIDDLADRPHRCGVLLDQNLHKAGEAGYANLLPQGATCLFGPAYALLREEFYHYDKKRKERLGRLDRVLVSFGGSDPNNDTWKVVQALKRLAETPKVDVVVGGAYPYKQELRKFCQQEKMSLHVQTKRMARLMQQADVAFGAGGSSVWERCYMKLPTVVIEAADNQTGVLSALKERGAVLYLGRSEQVTTDQIYEQLALLKNDPSLLVNLSRAAGALMEKHRPHAVADFLTGRSPDD
ncbi:UDP-2,4-diacetamido-2,4,6-trideoxy-beta-L-altropyranose hydrolase [Halobacillus sp. KGW1]|uniref:UDP-2,4-diacetamido-2,4, 6-trideoxy-beta-L-altropyranose hydrolase n=1 Tax=Halobacillus sp. KGW1 TaxID=1793726 RepID=UPI000783C67C|nr:UDP-2,4-diacetamido-2,4,6-trideoxy-beta-L-altropyranose hydrolase [Halobacillus sp. KGW1]